MTNNMRWVLALLTAAFLAACDSEGDAVTAPAFVPAAQPVWCAIAGRPEQPHVVSGQVFDAYSGLVPDATVALWVELSRSGGPCSVRTDQSGQFVAYLPDSKFSLHIHKPGFVQQCAVSAEVRGDIALQVEVTSASTFESLEPPRPQTAHGTTFGGHIFETISGARAPVNSAQIWVQYYDDIPVATTLTDQLGGYFVCNLPEVVGVYVSKPGYATEFVVARPLETPTRDIELKRRS